MLIIIDALRICTADVVAWLAGYTDYSYCRKSLMRLYNNGYVSIVKGNNGKNCYFLKSKGLKSIGKYNSRVYEVSSMTNHCLEVGIVCAWLRATRKLHFSEMLLDMQLRESQAVGEHRPDIVVGNLAIEVELNHKRKETLTRNVLSNELTYDGQVWLVPQRKANIRRSLAEIFQIMLLRMKLQRSCVWRTSTRNFRSATSTITLGKHRRCLEGGNHVKNQTHTGAAAALE